MDKCMTADMGKIIKDASALYELYNLFGRGKISEEEFCFMYMTGRLAGWIDQTYKHERSE